MFQRKSLRSAQAENYDTLAPLGNGRRPQHDDDETTHNILLNTRTRPASSEHARTHTLTARDRNARAAE